MTLVRSTAHPDTGTPPRDDRSTVPSLPLSLPAKQHAVVVRTIERWHAAQVVDDAQRAHLLHSITASPFDWQKAARYAFAFAVVCLVVMLGAVLEDKLLMALLAEIFHAPALAKCLGLCVLAAGLFALGLRTRRRAPHRYYSSEALFFLGVLALAGAITFFGEAIDTGSGHFSVLLLMAAVLYGLLGLWFPSRLVWVFALLSFASWLGAESGYVSGWGAYYLGMNYPARFVIIGLLMAALGVWGQQRLQRRPVEVTAAPAPHALARDAATFLARLDEMAPQTKVVGLLCLFIALWIMSIFGNYGSIEVWRSVRQIELLQWSLLFGLAAVAAIVWGLRHDDGVMRGFGLTFLGLNLYTRYFEYCWDLTHKALFFGLLGLSFWALGRHAERLWHWGEVTRPVPAHSAGPATESQDAQS
jgi:MFS family permease